MDTGDVTMTLVTNDVRIRSFEQADEPEVLDLLHAAFGAWSGGITGVDRGEFFRWKHMSGPFGPSTATVAVINEKIIGFLAWLPWLLCASTQTLRTTRAIDFAVHPEYRARGVGAQLIREGRRYVPDDVAFEWANPNELSHPRALKSGQGEVGRLPRFVGLLPLPTRGALLRACKRGPTAAQPPPKIEAATAAQVLGDGVSPQLLPRLNSRDPRLRTAADLRYLTWRYGRYDEYRAVRTGATGESGVAIFRVCSGRRFRVAQVCELLVAPNDYRARRRLLKLVRRSAPVDFISCAFDSRGEASRCGFVQVGGGPVLTVRPTHTHLAPDPRRAASWGLSLGDLELA
jgi:GNAT superfamily N-acetyltransferase